MICTRKLHRYTARNSIYRTRKRDLTLFSILMLKFIDGSKHFAVIDCFSCAKYASSFFKKRNGVRRN